VLTTTAAPAATALSADADIQWLVDGANKLKIGFILLAIAIAGLGVAFGAVHFATHRDQWFQSIQIIAGAFVAAAIMFHVDNIMRLAAAGALLR
jgi:hypothetical protein